MYIFALVRIEEELKLDYSDVLFRPKRSTLQSRKDVNLKRTYRFKYSNNDLILTSPFHNTSTWQLPETYFQDFKSPEGSDGFFMRKFRTDKQKCLVDTSGQWQEAVLDVESNPKVIDWAIELITQYS